MFTIKTNSDFTVVVFVVVGLFVCLFVFRNGWMWDLDPSSLCGVVVKVKCGDLNHLIDTC